MYYDISATIVISSVGALILILILFFTDNDPEEQKDKWKKIAKHSPVPEDKDVINNEPELNLNEEEKEILTSKIESINESLSPPEPSAYISFQDENEPARLSFGPANNLDKKRKNSFNKSYSIKDYFQHIKEYINIINDFKNHITNLNTTISNDTIGLKHNDNFRNYLYSIYSKTLMDPYDICITLNLQQMRKIEDVICRNYNRIIDQFYLIESVKNAIDFFSYKGNDRGTLSGYQNNVKSVHDKIKNYFSNEFYKLIKDYENYLTNITEIINGYNILNPDNNIIISSIDFDIKSKYLNKNAPSEILLETKLTRQDIKNLKKFF